MRAAIYSLLLCNVLFFAWANWIDRPSTVSPSAAVAESLKLAAQRPSEKTRCATLGPFDSAESAQSVASSLSIKGVGARVRQAMRPISDGYWVYLRGLTDAAARQQAIRKLARAGIRDAAELSNEQQRDRVSLGLFNERDGAQQRLARARAAGFDPVVEERQRQVAEYWLDADLLQSVALPNTQEFASLTSSSSAEVSWRECPATRADG